MLLSKSKKVKNIFDNYVAIKQKIMFEDDRWRARWWRRVQEGREKGSGWEGEELDEGEEFGFFTFWFDILDVGK